MTDAAHAPARKGPEPPDLSEKGGMKNGQPQRSDVRLFMQFLAFGACEGTEALVDAMDAADVVRVRHSSRIILSA